LGFYTRVLVILEVGVIAALGVAATTDSLHPLAPWILGFGAIVLVALIATVVVMNIRAPEKLQLGELSGREFIDYYLLTQGDSATGERLESIPAVEHRALDTSTASEALPPPSEEEDEDRRSLPRSSERGDSADRGDAAANTSSEDER
jgi:hypothetical protein